VRKVRKAFGDAVFRLIGLVWGHYWVLFFSVLLLGTCLGAFRSPFAALGLVLVLLVAMFTTFWLPNVPTVYLGRYVVFLECILVGLVTYVATRSLVLTLASPAAFLLLILAAIYLYPEEELEESPYSVKRWYEKWARKYAQVNSWERSQEEEVNE